MVTLRKIEKQDKDTILGEIVGLSTDTKPTEMGGKTVANGSSFVEMDTGNIFLFDQANEEWSQFSGGSGGGGSEQQVVFINQNNGTLDIKPSDILDANNNVKDKSFILKGNGSGNAKLFIPLYSVQVDNDDVFLEFVMNEDLYKLNYEASISEDNYFTYFE